MIPKVSGKMHPDVLGEVVNDPWNLSPICREEHVYLDRNKIKAFRERGVTGLVDFIGGGGYPTSKGEELMVVQRRHFVYVLENIINKIRYLNGDAPIQHRDDYKRASDRGNHYIDRLLTLGIE